MKNKFLKITAYCLALLILFIGILPVSAENNRSVNEAQGFINDIVDNKMSDSGASSIQQLINGYFSENAGTMSEWYVIALSQNGSYDFSAYETALIKYLNENEVYSASSRQKYALALIATGSTNQYIYRVLNDSIGQQGIMSWIFGLHLLNNGYSSNNYSLSGVVQTILSLQLSDGGWALRGTTGDVDVTAMAIQALAPYYQNDTAVKIAIDNALLFLSNRQLPSGDYASYGVNNLESTVQVLVALSSLGIDCKSDSRFIKDGKTLFDVVCSYQLSYGRFSHKQGGEYNETATVQVLYSMVSYVRMMNGNTALYILDRRNPSELQTSDPITSKPDEVTSSNSQSVVNDNQYTTTSNQNETNSLGNHAVIDNQSTTTGRVPTNTSSTNGTEQATNATQRQSVQASEKVAESQTEKSSKLSENKQDSATTTVATNNNGIVATKSESKVSYKLWFSLAIIVIDVGVCVVLYFMKKRNKKNFIIVFAVAIVLICLVLITNFQTTDNYYNNTDGVKENAVGTVTLTIRCDTIVDKAENEHIPENGIILDTTEFEIEDGDTAYDILTEAVAKNEIHMETSGGKDSVYVQGINYIYEFAFGDLSGWIYHINGEEPSVSCGEYKLSDGDVIEFLYSCELGDDVQ